MNLYWVAAVWIDMALLASLVSIRIGVSVALVEIVAGAIVGNIPGHERLAHQTDFTEFLATLGSVVLTFLAGAEIDPVNLRRHWRPSLLVGVVSFAMPFLGAFAFALWALHWELHAAEIAGISLSTTSVAVVYAVMIETGLNRTDLGKLILAACFVTDLGTVLALGGLFADFTGLLGVFVAVTVAALAILPWMMREVIARVGGRVSEPELKFLLLVLFGLGGLASAAGSEAVLPAYLVGLVVAGVFLDDRVLVDRMRSTAFALLTPFFFLRAGFLISFSALEAGAGVVAALFGVKMITKLAGVWPTAAAVRIPHPERTYTTLLMATGLTFGSISALFGLTNHLITQTQYSELVIVVILSAFVPALVAQKFFEPQVAVDEQLEEALEAEDYVPHAHHRAGSGTGATAKQGRGITGDV